MLTWHDKCNICCRYCICHVKSKVCLDTKPLEVFSLETEWLNASPRFLMRMYNKTIIEFGFRMISWIIKTSCLIIHKWSCSTSSNNGLLSTRIKKCHNELQNAPMRMMFFFFTKSRNINRNAHVWDTIRKVLISIFHEKKEIWRMLLVWNVKTKRLKMVFFSVYTRSSPKL